MPTHHHLDRDRNPMLRRTGSDAAAPESGPAAHPLLTLQRQIGNSGVARSLGHVQRCACAACTGSSDAVQRHADEHAEDELAQAQRDPALQREEAVPEEEDELAQAQRDPALQREEAVPEEEEDPEKMMAQAQRDPALQREEAAPEEEEELAQAQRDPALQREEQGPEVGLEGGPVSDATGARINSMRGGGSPLDDATRTSMESSFGADLSDVRVHTGSEARDVSTNIGAKAFTTGSDIFFGPNGNPSDRGLLAHELTHVVQQRTMDTSGPMTVGPAGDSYEQEADATAAAVTSGATIAPKREEQ